MCLCGTDKWRCSIGGTEWGAHYFQIVHISECRLSVLCCHMHEISTSHEMDIHSYGHIYTCSLLNHVLIHKLEFSLFLFRYNSAWNHHCGALCIFNSGISKLQAPGWLHHGKPLLLPLSESAEAALLQSRPSELEDGDSDARTHQGTQNKVDYGSDHGPRGIACCCGC